jgi:transcriptional regulator GlxA family with amidase domain
MTTDRTELAGGSSRRIGILLFDGVEELDAVGPWEVLAFWSRRWPDDGWEVFTFSDDRGPVACAKGLRIVPDHSEEDRPELDVLIYPGGRGTRAHVEDPMRLDWVRARSRDGTLMTSVCTGSLVFAAAGLLQGRPATTYWAELPRLAELDPSIDVRSEDRFVDDGEVVTAAGVSAGIDMALHLVARLAGVPRASEVRRGIQYDPAPPVPNP